jgi:ferredoxin
VVLLDERPPEALREKVKAAVRFCPTLALRIEEE